MAGRQVSQDLCLRMWQAWPACVKRDTDAMAVQAMQDNHVVDS
jgi:hypothetical protein